MTVDILADKHTTGAGKSPSLMALLGGVMALCVVISAVWAPAISRHDPARLDLAERMQSPCQDQRRDHVLGTDQLGRDMFARVLYGGRISLAVAVSVVALSLTIGLAAGLFSGFYGGYTDLVINVYLVNAFLALPGILLAIAFVAFLGPSLRNLILALAITGWVAYARLVRALVMSVKRLEYVEAARALGASDLRLLVIHILPNIIQPVIIQAAVGLAGAVLAEATLSFLGLGVPPPTPSWGSMLGEARSHLFDAPYMAIIPALAVVVTVLSFNLVGDALRDGVER